MELTERNIPPDGLHLVVNLSLNGKSYPMVLDTGASKTIFDYDFYSEFFDQELISQNNEDSFSVEGKISESFIAPVDGISIDGIIITDDQIVLIKLDEINYVYSELGHEPIIGILGSDWLKKYKAVIDYSEMQLTLNSKSE